MNIFLLQEYSGTLMCAKISAGRHYLHRKLRDPAAAQAWPTRTGRYSTVSSWNLGTEDRENILFQPGMPAHSWGVFALSLQLQEVSVSSDVGLPEGGLPPSLCNQHRCSAGALLSPTQQNSCFVWSVGSLSLTPLRGRTTTLGVRAVCGTQQP